MIDIQTLRIEQINLFGDTQYRDRMSKDTADEYQEQMLEGVEFPPVLVVFDGTTYWLVDGYLRYFASQQAGFKDMKAQVILGTHGEAQVIAMGVNASHGVQRNNATKHAVVNAALKHPLTKKKSDSEIAKLCNVSVSFVGSIRHPEVNGQQKTRRKSSAQADQTRSNKLLDEENVVASAYKRIKRLNVMVFQKQIRIAILMNEKKAAIKDAKRAQAAIDRVQKAQK